MRDGGKLFARSFKGWGLLWIAIYILLGCAIHTWLVLFAVVAALSGVFQILHHVVMQQLMEGHADLSHTLHTVRVFIREQRGLLLQSIALRTIGVIVCLAWLAAYVFTLKHGTATPPAPPVATQNMWQFWMSLMSPLYNCILFPILVQFGGCVSAVLPMRRDGVPLSIARRLSNQAFASNIRSELMLAVLFLLGCFACIAVPLLIPVLVLYWMGVMECYYADVFRGGYSLKAVVRSAERATAPMGTVVAA